MASPQSWRRSGRWGGSSGGWKTRGLDGWKKAIIHAPWLHVQPAVRNGVDKGSDRHPWPDPFTAFASIPRTLEPSNPRTPPSLQPSNSSIPPTLQRSSAPALQPSSPPALRQRLQHEPADRLERVEDSVAARGDGLEVRRPLDPFPARELLDEVFPRVERVRHGAHPRRIVDLPARIQRGLKLP